jgi:hypothetical protein
VTLRLFIYDASPIDRCNNQWSCTQLCCAQWCHTQNSTMPTPEDATVYNTMINSTINHFVSHLIIVSNPKQSAHSKTQQNKWIIWLHVVLFIML